MNNYEVTKLSDKTPKAEAEKLQRELKAVKGVDDVTLLSSEHRVSISFRETQEPGHDTLQAAAKKAGFTLGAKV
jgi:cation transport ATPase